MAAAAGLRPKQADKMEYKDVWIVIEGHERNIRNEWEMTRVLAYNIACFGNSDKKKLAKSIKQFWRFPWDEPEDMGAKYREIMTRHAKNKVLREQINNND